MARRVFHLTPNGNLWQLKETGAPWPVKSFATKIEGLTYSRTYVKQLEPSQLVIHHADGTIESESTYGNDPFPPKG